jgi:cytochrome c-type biogenesis protein CcmH/NrfG
MNELAQIAILAYRHGQYRDAIELLIQATDADPTNWLARLYLAMSYQQAGRVSDAHRVYSNLNAECPDLDIQTKVQRELPQVEAEMRKRFAAQHTASRTDSVSNDTVIFAWQ